MNEFWWFLLGFLSGIVAATFGLFAWGRSIRQSTEKQRLGGSVEIKDLQATKDAFEKKKNRTMWG